MTKIKKRRVKSRLKRAICMTMSALFMASAVLIATIPVQEAKAGGYQIGVANNEGEKALYPGGTKVASIPQMNADNSTPVYTTGDGMFQFAYINRLNSSDKIAVIVGYVASRSLPGGILEIPDVVSGFKKLTDAQGTDLGYVAASQDGSPLYYAAYKEIEVPTGNIITKPVYDDDGNQIGTVSENEVKKETVLDRYKPCFYSEEYRGEWETLESEEMYYEESAGIYKPCITDDKKWIRDAEVAYISNQHVKSKTTEVSKWDWVLDNTPDVGVFSAGGNIETLRTGSKLLGIGDNAFRGCSSLTGIELDNGANTIGNYAFANCVNLKSVKLDIHSNISIIGHHAFNDCAALQSFTMPINVSLVGDNAFEGCKAMKSIVLYGDYNVVLSKIGPYAFKNCSSLQTIDFPSNFNQAGESLDLSLVAGCTSLKSIIVPDQNLTFTGTEFSFDSFKSMVGDEFYFAGMGVSEIHDTSTANSVAFKYLDGDKLYEKVVVDKQATGSDNTIIYRVDENNSLRHFHMGADVVNVDIPGSIGPYKITRIGSDSFQNNSALKRISIPSSITEIGASAFKGCYNLKDIIFAKPIKLDSIGEGAFHTQDVEDPALVAGNRNPVLTFTGDINPDSLPFQYAMNPNNNINRGGQEKSYITFYSGWPTNLTVKYNPEIDLNELIDYPKYDELEHGSISYPDTTSEQKTAAIEAVTVYEDYIKGITSTQPTQDQWDVINSALNVVLPNGIESVAVGLFSGKDEKGNTFGTKGVNEAIQSITMKSVQDIPAYAFYGCPNLQTVITENSGVTEGESVGDYAFGDCDSLLNVTLSPNINKLGLRPFINCQKLTYAGFGEGGNFTCTNGIIFGLTDGEKTSIAECLETRGLTGDYAIGSSMIKKSELEGITSIADEAFMDCLGIGDVDLSTSAVKEIPVSCFENTTNLFSVEIPDTTTVIRERSFKNSGVRSLTIPRSVTFIDSTAFTNESGGINKNITISCEEGSAAENFANLYGLTLGEMLVRKFTVTFYDWYDGILDTQKVPKGEDAKAPQPPVIQGYTFKGWKGDFTSVSRDLSIYAYYDRTDEDIKENTFTVTFYNWDEEEWDKQYVVLGKAATTPVSPTREGYYFTGWLGDYSNIQADTKVYAQFEKEDPADTRLIVNFYNHDGTNLISTQKVEPGESAYAPANPTREGYKFTGWFPAYTNITKNTDVYAQFEKSETSGSSTNSSTTDGEGNGGDTDKDKDKDKDDDKDKDKDKTYTVTVVNGTGSGSYKVGTTVTITAGTVSGKKFTGWTTNSSGVTLASKTAPSTTFVMPANNVDVTANYSNSGSTTTTTNNSNSTSTVSGNSSTSKNKTNGSVVDISKTGISNKDKASASVSGSSDNFVVKITDSESARSEVESALLAEYGSLDDIKFFAMDISLYDSTGNTKITNTSGLSVTVTMPIPDALAEYAGNNKAAGVVNQKLDKLSPKFTSIDGVPCISFVATHFSPYTVYVDTANLTAGATIDSSPTTGDGIHPKWFLVIGLAALSILTFSATGRKKKVIVRA